METGELDDKNAYTTKKTGTITRPPLVAIMGWVLLRVVLGIDMAILFELVGTFVLRASVQAFTRANIEIITLTLSCSVDYGGKGMADHSNPLYTTLAGCVGGVWGVVAVFKQY